MTHKVKLLENCSLVVECLNSSVLMNTFSYKESSLYDADHYYNHNDSGEIVESGSCAPAGALLYDKIQLEISESMLNEWIHQKVFSGINKGIYENGQDGYVETHLIVWDDGRWETTCRNEYGSRYGTMKQGNISLPRLITEYIQSFPWKHVSIPLYTL